MSSQTSLGRVGRPSGGRRSLAMVRGLLLFGWVMATIGYYGSWIAHPAAALALSGADISEFAKFLPGVLDGSLRVMRHLFLLPPFSVAVIVALLVGSRQLCFSWPLRVAMLFLAGLASLQLLPPAWSPSSLVSGEFRLQTIALGVCWLLLANFWLLGRLPPRLTGSLSTVLSLAAMGLSAWQFLTVKPAIDAVYRMPVSIGWAVPGCMAGLAATAAGSIVLVLRTRGWSR